MAKNLIGGNTTTINENNNNISVDLNEQYTNYIDINETLQTTAQTLPTAINENKNRLDDLMYVENVRLITGWTIPANNSPATQTYTLSPRPGYTPILVTTNNLFNGVVNLWYVNLFTDTGKINWRAHNTSSSQVTNITIKVRVLYVKTDSFLGEFSL